MRIKNLTNSPYEIQDANGGKVMIPARGEVTVDPHHMIKPYIKSVGYFEVDEDEKPKRRSAKE